MFSGRHRQFPQDYCWFMTVTDITLSSKRCHIMMTSSWRGQNMTVFKCSSATITASYCRPLWHTWRSSALLKGVSTVATEAASLSLLVNPVIQTSNLSATNKSLVYPHPSCVCMITCLVMLNDAAFNFAPLSFSDESLLGLKFIICGILLPSWRVIFGVYCSSIWLANNTLHHK